MKKSFYFLILLILISFSACDKQEENFEQEVLNENTLYPKILNEEIVIEEKTEGEVSLSSDLEGDKENLIYINGLYKKDIVYKKGNKELEMIVQLGIFDDVIKDIQILSKNEEEKEDIASFLSAIESLILGDKVFSVESFSNVNGFLEITDAFYEALYKIRDDAIKKEVEDLVV